MSQIDLSIIIVNWKVRPLLEKCLDSILKNQKDYNLEIFVIDNDSRDGTSEMLMIQYPQVKCIALPRNIGFAAANNLALEIARGKNILLLNPDTELISGFFEKAFKYLDQNPGVSVIGPKIKNNDQSIQPSVRRSPDLLSQIMVLLKLSNVFPENKYLSQYYHSDFDYQKEQEVDQIMGAAMLIRAEVLEKIGFFDERFFIWFEEVDWCKRAKKEGFKIKYVPSLEIFHQGGRSFSQRNIMRRQFIFDKSMFKYFLKHKSLLQSFIIFIFIPINLILTFLYAAFFKKRT